MPHNMFCFNALLIYQITPEIKNMVHLKRIAVLTCFTRKMLYSVRSNFLTLVVQLTISFILSFITQVNTTGTGSGLSRKVWVTAYKVDAHCAVNL